MTHRRIDQLLAGYADGDAISQEARLFRDTFRLLGVESDIYAPAEHVAPRVAGDCRPITEFDSVQRDVLLYHYSTACRATDLFAQSPSLKILRYHNITPASFFKGFDDAMVEQLGRARAGLASVAGYADVTWADSTFNADEVADLGIQNVNVVSLLFGVEEFNVVPDPMCLARFGGPLKNIVSVGRVVPNKCVEELILGFAWYHREINPFSRLIIVGSEHSCPSYYAMLRLLAERLDLQNVCFEGFLSNEERSAVYHSADLFVSTSRHEGYCLPLIEAIYHEVPAMARECGGMPEALGGSGVLFDHAKPQELAELMHRVLSDAALRDDILASQAARLRAVKGRDIAAECEALLSGVSGPGH